MICQEKNPGNFYWPTTDWSNLRSRMSWFAIHHPPLKKQIISPFLPERCDRSGYIGLIVNISMSEKFTKSVINREARSSNHGKY
jgi:hypothetical protein